MTTIARRAFLLALGAGLIPAPAAAELGASSGAAGAPARRFVGVYMPHGRCAELYAPRADFELDYADSVLAPFAAAAPSGRSLREQLLVIEGLDLAAGFLTGTVGHDAPRVLLTGAGRDGKNASIDQYLSLEQPFAASTPTRNLVLGVGNDALNVSSCISYGRGGVPLPKLIHPAATFDALFGAPLTGSPEQASARRRRGQSALDFLRDDLRRLARRAPAAEREKLEHHAAALRDIERRLSPDQRLACSEPERLPSNRFPRFRANGGGERHFEAITELQIQLLVRAFACDITRFATLMLPDLSRTGLDPSLPDDIHQDVAHRYLARSASRPGDPASWRLLAKQNRHSCSKVAQLAGLLEAQGLLRDTLVLASSDMGDPARHSSRAVPTLVLGGGVRGGRVLELGNEGRVTRHRLNPNNRLLAGICRQFGVDLRRFGDSAEPQITEGVLDLS